MSKIIVPYVKTEGHQCAYNQETGAELWTVNDLIDDANEIIIDKFKEIKNLQTENTELKRKLDLTVEAMSYVINHSGTSTDYNKKCIESLKEIKEIFR